MKQRSTLFLRAAIIAIGLIALVFCVFFVPNLGIHIGIEFPGLAYVRYPLMIVMYGAAIPFFIILGQGWKLLGYIDKNTAFSEKSVHALKHIKRCAIAIGVLYATTVPLVFFPIAQIDDAPGLIIFGAFIAAVPFVFAVFTALLQRLLQNVIDIKSENDLTV